MRLDLLCETSIDVILDLGDDGTGIYRDGGALIVSNASKRSHLC